jgi:hypothetical protein
MAFAAETTYFDRGDGSILGSFTEKEYGKHFEFSTNNENFNTEYPHKVWVTTPWRMDSGWRFAKVLKTRAYVLTNNEAGEDVVEKWYHKKYTEYRPG